MVGTVESASIQQNSANISSLGQMMTQEEEIQRGGGQGMSGMSSGMTQGGGEMQHEGGRQGVSGMSSGMEHNGGGQGMSGMKHNTRDTPGVIKICNMGEDMPTHYCEPSFQVMSSVKGVKVRSRYSN